MMKFSEVKDKVYKALTEYRDVVNSKMFSTLYTALNQKYDPDVVSAVTQLFLKNKINPLESLIYVPMNFLADADIKTIDLKNVQWIESDAFYMSGLESVIMPTECDQISSNAFYMCFNLKDVKFGPVEMIGTHAFEGTAIKEVSITAPKVSLRRQSFGACQNLERVKIDSPIVRISADAFANCEKLRYFEFPKLSKQQVIYIDLPLAVSFSSQKLLVNCADGQLSLKGE